jgi:glycosyltransferase involved in cell wall biosynthesis
MKFSIVTPCFNSERWIRETIESVLSQSGDFDVEYIIMDGGSTDGTLDIIRKYKDIKLFSEKDAGMYDAINRGFEHATGDIFAYINSDDKYEPGAFRAMAEIFSEYPDIMWLKGVASGVYGMQSYHVAQDSVFWRKELWNKVKPIPTKYKLAGDYWLWTQFANFNTLWTASVPASNYRKHKNQLSRDISKYKKEQKEIQTDIGKFPPGPKIFFSLLSKLLFLKPFFIHLYPLLFKQKLHYLEFENNEWAKKISSAYVLK